MIQPKAFNQSYYSMVTVSNDQYVRISRLTVIIVKLVAHARVVNIKAQSSSLCVGVHSL